MLPPFAHSQEKETNSWKETITWGVMDIPPSHILTGPDAGTGPADQLLRLMQDRLPQYDHHIEILPNLARLVKSLDHGTRVCSSVGLYRPPGHPARDKRAQSIPTTLFFTSRIAIRQSDRHLFGETVSFEDLLHNQEFIFGHFAGCAYPPQLEKILSAYQGIESYRAFSQLAFSPKEQMDVFLSKPNIYARTGEDGGGLLKMLLTGRIDYLVLFPFATAYIIEQGVDVATVPIAELRDTPTGMFAFLCSPTEEGRQVIKEINAILKTERDTPEYRAIMEWFVEPKEREEEYWKLYEEHLLTVFE
jgi:hypothetical protein